MTHIKKIIRVRKTDYDALFNQLVKESKNKGYTDLHNFLTNWCNGMQSKDSHNIDTTKWSAAEIRYEQQHREAQKTNTALPKALPVLNEKTIIEQARSLGVKVRYNGIDTMHLKDYYPEEA